MSFREHLKAKNLISGSLTEEGTSLEYEAKLQTKTVVEEAFKQEQAGAVMSYISKLISKLSGNQYTYLKMPMDVTTVNGDYTSFYVVPTTGSLEAFRMNFAKSGKKDVKIKGNAGPDGSVEIASFDYFGDEKGKATKPQWTIDLKGLNIVQVAKSLQEFFLNPSNEDWNEKTFAIPLDPSQKQKELPKKFLTEEGFIIKGAADLRVVEEAKWALDGNVHANLEKLLIELIDNYNFRNLDEIIKKVIEPMVKAGEAGKITNVPKAVPSMTALNHNWKNAVINSTSMQALNAEQGKADKSINADGSFSIAVQEIVEDERVSVEQLFDDLESLVKLVIETGNPHNSLIVAGQAGIGKSVHAKTSIDVQVG
jgi:hypothetical protein